MRIITQLLFAGSLIFTAQAANEASLSSTENDCHNLLRLSECTFCYTEGPKTDAFVPYASNLADGVANQKYYELVTCNFPGQCPDQISRSNCAWKRVFALGCLNNPFTGSMPYLVVGTNSLPNHCYYDDNNAPIGSPTVWNAVGFGIEFNTPVRDMLDLDPDTKVLTSDDFEICEPTWAKVSGLDSYVHYSEWFSTNTDINVDVRPIPTLPLINLRNFDNIVGVALNGVFLFSANTHQGYDAFFPQAYGNKRNPIGYQDSLDICLGTSVTSRTYRYHMFSPCIHNIPALRTKAEKCSSSTSFPNCNRDIRAHAIAHIPEQLQTLTPIGIAKDGRIIYGPFRSDGMLWQPCDVDACNGRMFGRHYGYVATMFHPYFVGCWGPGNKSFKSAQCSSNSRSCSSGASQLLGAISLILVAALSILSL